MCLPFVHQVGFVAYFTPLFAACMNRHNEIVELLTAVPECDVNKGPDNVVLFLIGFVIC